MQLIFRFKRSTKGKAGVSDRILRHGNQMTLSGETECSVTSYKFHPLFDNSRLNSKSEVLANRARSRECSRSRVSLDASLEPERNRRSRSRSRSNRAHFSTDSKAPMPPLSDAIATESKKSPDAKRSRPEAAFRQNISLLSNQESFQSSHVFDRLAARSREYALRMRSQSNERPQVSPGILDITT
jgi:hypothetical protein